MKALESNYSDIKRRIEEKLDNIKENTDSTRKLMNLAGDNEISIPEIDIIKYNTKSEKQEYHCMGRNFQEIKRIQHNIIWNLKDKLVELINSRKVS